MHMVQKHQDECGCFYVPTLFNPVSYHGVNLHCHLYQASPTGCSHSMCEMYNA